MKFVLRLIAAILLTGGIPLIGNGVSEQHEKRFHWDGTIQAVQVDENHQVRDTPENRLAKLNNEAGEDNSLWMIVVGCVLFTMGLNFEHMYWHWEKKI